MNNRKQSTSKQKCQIHKKRLLIKFILIFNKLRLVNPFKLNQSLIGYHRGNSRVRSWALTSLNTACSLNIQTAQLTLMNRSAVISAWCRGGKSMDFSISNTFANGSNRHGVASVDFINILPTNQMAGKGIYNLNSFIKENNLGMNKDLIADETNQSSPDTGSDQSKVKSIINNLQIEHRGHYPKGHTRKNVTTFRSKDVGIVHPRIFSRLQEKQVA